MPRKRIPFVAFSSVVLAVSTAGQVPPENSRTLARDIEKPERVEVFRTDPQITFKPMWSGNRLIGEEMNRTSEPIIWSIDRNDEREEVAFSIPGAAQLYLWCLAATSDGVIAVVGTAVGNDLQGSGFLGIIPRDRSKKTVTRTWPYVPKAVTISRDGIIWTVGRSVDGESGKRVYNVLKRFDQTGALISTLSMRVRGAVGADATDASTLRASRDRVGWLTAAGEYIEFSLAGQEIQRFAAPPWNAAHPTLTTLAISEQNDVIAAVDGKGMSVWSLNRSSGTWIPAHLHPESPSNSGIILGFDGNDLVVGSWLTGPSRVNLYSLPRD